MRFAAIAAVPGNYLTLEAVIADVRASPARYGLVTGAWWSIPAASAGPAFPTIGN